MTEMSVDPLKEPLEATVSPVQVDPFSDAQTQNHIIFWSLCQKKIIALQYIISLKERRDEKNRPFLCNSISWIQYRLLLKLVTAEKLETD